MVKERARVMCKRERWERGQIVFGGISITFRHVRKLVMLLSSKHRREKIERRKGSKKVEN